MHRKNCLTVQELGSTQSVDSTNIVRTSMHWFHSLTIQVPWSVSGINRRTIQTLGRKEGWKEGRMEGKMEVRKDGRKECLQPDQFVGSEIHELDS